MPRSWSEAVKACRRHPKGVRGRACSCRVGWRYRMGLPDPATGVVSAPKWSPTFPTKELADGHQRQLRSAIADGVYVADRGLTLGEFLADWLARKEASGRKVSTLAGYRSIVETHLVPRLGKHRLGALRPDHVQAMLDELQTAPAVRRKTPVSTGTLTNIRACLRAALSDAVRRQLVPRNVAVLVELPAVKRPAPIAVQTNRLAVFLAHVEADPLAALWATDATYGMRRAELCGIRWPDVDQGAKLIRIRQTLVEVPGLHPCQFCGAEHRRMVFETPKSAAGVRSYPLVPEVEAALIAHRLRQDDERALYGDDYADHDLVFAQPDGNPWPPARISAAFKVHLLAAGLIAEGERVPPMKTLRSSAVTALHEAGAQLEVISKVIGHGGEQVTKDHYLAVNAERTRAEFAVIAARLLGGRSDRLTDHRPETIGWLADPTEEVNGAKRQVNGP